MATCPACHGLIVGSGKYCAKPCQQRVAYQKWRSNNLQRARALARKWHADNRERRRKYEKRYLRENRAVQTVRVRECRHKNPEHYRDYAFERSMKDLPENVREMRRTLLLFKRWCKANGFRLSAEV